MIRRVRPEDLSAVNEMIFRSKASQGYDADFMKACREELTLRPEDLEARMLWLAEGEPVAGTVGLIVENDRNGEICTMFVDPQCQGRGVGRRLWGTALDAARQIGLSRLHLDADPNAVPFYQKMGCILTGQAPSGSIPGRSLPVLEVRL